MQINDWVVGTIKFPFVLIKLDDIAGLLWVIYVV
jgi:hypothetical protein